MSTVLPAELRLLAAITQGRRRFEARLTEHAYPILSEKRMAPKALKNAIDKITNERTYHIASFYYIADKLSLLTPDKLPKLILQHNADMARLHNDSTRLRLMRITTFETKYANINEKTISDMLNRSPRSADNTIFLSMSDLSRFLTPMMVKDSCFYTLYALQQANLIELFDAHRRKYVATNGLLEKMFHEHISIIHTLNLTL